MNIEKYFDMVDVEEIYKTILDLEGPKFPLDNFDKLDKAASYIIEKLESYNIKTEVQEFYLEGFEKPFKNVLGYIGDQSKPAVLLGSHYDTVRFSPGANDNLSAVAVSLEMARILSKIDNPPTVIVAVFTLEEGHPTKNKRVKEVLQKDGWLDQKGRFTSSKIYHFNKLLNKMLMKKWKEEKLRAFESLEIVLKENENIFDDVEKSYIETLIPVFKGFKKLSVTDKLSSSLVGSSLYVEKVLKEKIDIKYIINYDCLGWINNNEGTQKLLPISEEMRPFLQLHKTTLESTVGNYIGIMGERNSKNILDTFMNHCSMPEIDIPHLGLYLPIDFKTIHESIGDVLRSDHAPFWEAGIKGLFISDTANFRSPHYHTGGDTYDRIDYNMLAKITTASLRTIIDLDL